MKKIFFVAGCIFSIGLTTISCSRDHDDEVIIAPTTLPSASQTFLATHFPNINVTRAERSQSSEYEVILSNGFEVDFNANGDWSSVKVKGNGNILPASILALIPSAIQDHITNNQNLNLPIIEIEKKPYGYEIQLINNLELRFDFKGGFLGLGN